MRAFPVLSVAAWLCLTPIGAHAETWVTSGTLDQALDQCVDKDSIKSHDGLTSYSARLCNLKREADSPGARAAPDAEAVECGQDMSGSSIEIKQRSETADADGNYTWFDTTVAAGSMAGQTAKFVCGK